MLLGVDYYPEQWEPSRLEEDLSNIIELGANVIRIGEFGWTLMEKQEGDYDFSYFDKVIQQAKAKGLKVIFGTPTATMPAWLAKKYPEVLSEFEDGNKRVFGGRRQYCFNSDRYYTYSQKIIEALVKHYKDEEAIIAWQIDNEFGHEGSDLCYCKSCEVKFQSYLKQIYEGDINLLNEKYGTVFWSQQYSCFEEIPLPKATITTHNPSLCMDWERFRSKSVEDYADYQCRWIKNIIPQAIVIHDFPGGGMQKHYDFSKVAQKLDRVAYNNYPVWGGQKEPIKPYEIAFGLDYMRGLKGENFWVTEAIMGAQGHNIIGYLPRPNQAKLWSYQGMAHGCEAMLYFRYRGATKGAEQFCYGILDSDNVKRRKYYEVQDFFKHIVAYEQLIKAPIQNEVALIYDYESMSSFRIQRQSSVLEYEEECKNMYAPYFKYNIGVDIIPSDRDFSKYRLVVIPLMIVWKPSFEKRLKEYVEQGGKVVFSYRTAVKDEYNNLIFGKVLPAYYEDLIGAHVIETESLQERDSLLVEGINDWEALEGKAGIFREMLEVTTAKPLLKYKDDFYDSFSAATAHSFGKGKVYYIGCSLEAYLMEQVMSRIIDEIGLVKNISPQGVEVVRRTVQGKQYYFIMNHLGVKVDYRGLELEPYGCVIEEREEEETEEEDCTKGALFR